METIQLFIQNFLGNLQIDNLTELAASGSERKNYIFAADNKKYVLTTNENIDENKQFFYFSNIFTNLKLNTPKILKISTDKKWYIQEFLGENTLFDLLTKKENTTFLVKKSLEKLYELQIKTNGKIDFSKTLEYTEYNHIPILHDLFYFKFMFVDVLEIAYNKQFLIEEFHQLVKHIEELNPKGLMLRDFQSRNIMVANNEVFFIDYQSAMLGPLMYDVISFLFQAKANFSKDFKNNMLDFYIQLHDNEETKTQLRKSILPLRLIRNLQVLGAYGFRGLIQKKSHFIESIPQGIENLLQNAEEWNEINNFPELKKLIQNIEKKQKSSLIL